MTQVDIKKLDSLTHNDTAATKLINDNFKAIEKALEDSLSRVSNVPNYMDTDLDMNTKKIINVQDPVEDNDVANKKYIDRTVGNAQEYAREAEVSATKSETYANYVQVTKRGIDAKYDEIAQIQEDVAKVGVNVKYNPYKRLVTFLPENWIEEILEDGKRYYSNMVEIPVSDVVNSNQEIHDITAFVNFLRPQALDGSYLNFAQVYQTFSDGYVIVCKIFKRDSAPDTDVTAYLSLFCNIEEN